jgi:hypothetical protein
MRIWTRSRLQSLPVSNLNAGNNVLEVNSDQGVIQSLEIIYKRYFRFWQSNLHRKFESRHIRSTRFTNVV